MRKDATHCATRSKPVYVWLVIAVGVIGAIAYLKPVTTVDGGRGKFIVSMNGCLRRFAVSHLRPATTAGEMAACIAELPPELDRTLCGIEFISGSARMAKYRARYRDAIWELRISW